MKTQRLIIPLICLVILMQSVANAGAPVRLWKTELGDPTDPGDDYAYPVNLKWSDNDLPLLIALFRDGYNNVIAPASNPNNLQDYEILRALNNALERWNEAELSYFEFQDNAVYSDFLIGINPSYPYGPVGHALDRFNLVTFQDPDIVLEAGVFAVASWFYFTQDFDASASWGVPVEVIGGQELVPIDIDGDGFIDVYLPRIKYETGTIIDCDILMNQVFDGWNLAPEDPPSGAAYADWLGVADIEGILEGALARLMGISHSYLYMATITGYGYRTTGDPYPTDPWAFRELDFEDKMTLAMIYPNGTYLTSKGIRGEVLDGNSPQVSGAGIPGVDAPVVMAPVYAGLPRLDGRQDLDTIQSDRGPIQLIAQVYTGKDLRIPVGLFASQAEQTNGMYEILGLSPAPDYAVYLGEIDPAFAAVDDIVEQYAGTESYIPEFYGGCDLPLPGESPGTHPDLPGDNIFGNNFIKVAANQFGQFTMAASHGPTLLFGYPEPGTSFVTILVEKNDEITTYTNFGEQFGSIIDPFQINEATQQANGQWRLGNALLLEENLRVVNTAGDNDYPDDLQISFTFTNQDTVPLTIQLRNLMDTAVGYEDRAIFVVDDENLYEETRIIPSPGVPFEMTVVDDIPDALTAAIFKGNDLGLVNVSEIVIAAWNNIINYPYFYPNLSPALGVNASAAFYYGPYVLFPGKRATFRITYGFLRDNNSFKDCAFDDNPVVSEPVMVDNCDITKGVIIVTNATATITPTPTPVGPTPTPTGTPEPTPTGTPGPTPTPTPPPSGTLYFIDYSPANGGQALPPEGVRFHTYGAAAGDIDNDGDLDIIIVNGAMGPEGPSSLINRIYLNDGRGYFTDVTFGIDGMAYTEDDRWLDSLDADYSYHVNLADFDGDGDLDIFVSNFASNASPFPGAQNRLYINEDIDDPSINPDYDDDDVGDGFFRDVTANVLPGILNFGPFVEYGGRLDRSTRCDVGDIDSDGDIDIVVSNYDRFFDPEGTSSGEYDLAFSERILINHLNDRDPAQRRFEFTDETLGADGLFGGWDEDYDRIVPLFPDLPGTQTDIETDISETMQVVLSPVWQDGALDLVVADAYYARTHHVYHGQMLVYSNRDTDGDGIADGYFDLINWNFDFFIPIPNVPTQAVYHIGIPDGFNGDAPSPDVNIYEFVRENRQGLAVNDFINSGWNQIVTFNPGPESKFIPSEGPGYPYGTSRGRYTYLAGLGLAYYFNAIPGIDFWAYWWYVATMPQEARFEPQRGRARGGVVADFDNDGDRDIVILNDALPSPMGFISEFPGPLELHLNNTFAEFEDRTEGAFWRGNDSYSMYGVPADFDNDGDIDIFVCNAGAQNELLFNQLYNEPPYPYNEDDPAMFVDVTVQGIPPYYSGATIPPSLTSMSNSSVNSDIADVDGDGDLDIVIANGGIAGIGGEYQLLLINAGEPINQGVHFFKPSGSTFPAPRLLLTEDWGDVFMHDETLPCYQMKFADFDNDGDPDIFQSNNRSKNRMLVNVDSDFFVENSVPDDDEFGDGLFEDMTASRFLFTYPDYDTREFSFQVAVGDVNSDGLIDVVVANGLFNTGAPNLLLLNQFGPGPNAPAGYFHDASANFPTTVYHDGKVGQYQDDTSEPALADFDGDGDLDLFFANRGPISEFGSTGEDFFPSCRFLLNNGDGTFIEADGRIPNIISRCEGVLVADFDRDGEPTEDINGNGILDPGEDMNHNGMLDWDDRNGNGIFDPDYDILVLVADGQNIMLINDGEGRFTDETFDRIPLIYNESYGGDVGDVDLDGDLDIIVANHTPWNESCLQLLLNDGAGVFTDVSYEIPNPDSVRLYGDSPGSTHIDNNANDVSLIDYDNDGDLDIFVSISGENTPQSLVGFYNYLFMNRLIGSNWNSRSIIKVRTPGGPIVRTSTPHQALAGTMGLEVTILGNNFKEGCTVNFGQGIDVVGEPELELSNVLKVTINVKENAVPGGRQITVTNPDGREGRSHPNTFIVTTTSIPYPVVETNKHWTLYQ